MKKAILFLIAPCLILIGLIVKYFRKYRLMLRKKNSKTITFSDATRSLLRNYKNFKVVDENKLKVYDTKTIYGLKFKMLIIPKNSRLIVDDLKALSFISLRYCINETIPIFIREELLDCDEDTINFFINHEIGHILIPSSFGKDEFQIAIEPVFQHNFALALNNVYAYVCKHKLNIYNIFVSNNNPYKQPYDNKYTVFDKDYTEIASNIYATLATPNSEKVIKSFLDDLNPLVNGSNPAEKAFNKIYTLAILNRLLKISKNREEIYEENHREISEIITC